MSSRSRSGARLSGGASKNIAKHHARYKYTLCVVDDGTPAEPTEADMAYFQQKFPDWHKKLTDSSLHAGFEVGSWQEACFSIIDGLIKQKRAEIFRNPVDPAKEGLLDYFQVIKEPMDLGTVKMRLLSHFYSDSSSFAAAVRLTFSNAMTYNRPTTLPYEDANKLLAQFERKYTAAFAPNDPPAIGGTPLGASGLATGNGHSGAADPNVNKTGAPTGAHDAGSGAETGDGDPLTAAAPAGGAGTVGEAALGAAADDWDDEEEEDQGPAAPAEQPKEVISDEEDDDDDDEQEGGQSAGKEPLSAAQEGGKHPSQGGKAPADSGMDETADSEIENDDLSDSAMDSDAVQESGDEDNADEGDLVSENEMFGDDDDDDDDDDFDNPNSGGREEGDSQLEESEAEGYGGSGYGGESSMQEEGDDDGDDSEDEFI